MAILDDISEEENDTPKTALLDIDETKIDERSRDRVIRARVNLQTQNPFFSYLVMGLEPFQDYDGRTCYVDSNGRLGYNPEFINELSDDEIKTLLVHEVMHCALLHLTRKSARQGTAWNVACDMVVNNMLLMNDFKFTGILGKGILPAKNTLKVKGLKKTYVVENIDKKYVEEVYDEIRKIIEEELGDYKDSNGNVIPCKNKEYSKAVDNLRRQLKGFDRHKHSNKTKENDAEVESKEREWKKRLSEASTRAQQQGKSPSGIDRYVEQTLENNINWRELLYRYITQEIPFDYTYSRPSKRSIATRVYMPSTLKEHVDITVAVDTSGSIGDTELSEFLSEVISIANSFSSLRVNLLFWDVNLNNHYIIDKRNIDEILDLKINGGGGTDFKNIYGKIEELAPNTKLLIFFTDGYAYFPKEELYRTLWILTKNSAPERDIPFGETVKMVGGD